MTGFELSKIQSIIHKAGMDGWLFYDFRRSNDIAINILKIPDDKISSRRYFYFIPAKGNPIKIVNAIEAGNLDHLPGRKIIYASHKSLFGCLARALKNVKNIAMEYSPDNGIPYVSKVDAGTIELVKSFKVRVISSANLISHFTAVWSDKQFKENIPVAKTLTSIVHNSFNFIKNELSNNFSITEYDVQQFILNSIEKEHGYIAEHPPIAAINENSANPHYTPTQKVHKKIKKGDFILLDLWARSSNLNGVWSDITWVGHIDKTVPAKYMKIFNIVAEARDKAFKIVKNRFLHREDIFGYEVDDVARKVISKAGYEKYFIHRTGHSITTEGHGTGAHMDNYETHDDRLILPGTSFSIEPGIYLPGKFGIRSEIDVFIKKNREVISTGDVQKEVIPILAE
jgi:Xaa-Pro aminopeptidase